jgi:phosphatidylglycerol:prolipoprotein diacylglycerol transferase
MSLSLKPESEMIFSPLWHTLFDLLAALCSIWVYKINYQHFEFDESLKKRSYWTSLFIGIFTGAYLFGSLNLSISGPLKLGHSVVGAIFGGIVSIEIYKIINSIKKSTGAVYVLPLISSIAVGRLGCFFTGLPDNTYGIESNSIISVNFGDGIFRHPVQLYESFNMIILFIFLVYLKKKNLEHFKRRAFYYFVFFYSLQRFILEFLKPYSKILSSLNIFHLVCLFLMMYSLIMLRSSFKSIKDTHEDIY